MSIQGVNPKTRPRVLYRSTFNSLCGVCDVHTSCIAGSMKLALAPLLLLSLASLAGCASESTVREEDITSEDGRVLDFTFAGEVVASKATPSRKAVLTQLQYLTGAMTSRHNANAHVGFTKLANVEEAEEGEQKTVRYSATVQVVWPKGASFDSSYEVVLPRDITKLDAFNAAYDGTCGKNEYGRSTFWHDFNPKSASCDPKPEDVTRAMARVAPSVLETSGKLPEYARMLEDGALELVTVHGSIQNSSLTDEGSREMDSVVRTVESSLDGAQRADGAAVSGIVKSTVVTGTTKIAGRDIKVKLTAMFVSGVTGTEFKSLYGKASETADFIVYSGHSGLGSNINAFQAATQFKKGQYQILFLDGCQTLGYLGQGLHDRKAESNGRDRDPNGTVDLDVIVNVLPSYGDDGRTISWLYENLRQKNGQKNYNELLARFSPRNFPAVFGEEDNTGR